MNLFLQLILVTLYSAFSVKAEMNVELLTSLVYNNTEYYIPDKKVTYAEAEPMCNKDGGTLGDVYYLAKRKQLPIASDMHVWVFVESNYNKTWPSEVKQAFITEDKQGEVQIGDKFDEKYVICERPAYTLRKSGSYTFYQKLSPETEVFVPYEKPAHFHYTIRLCAYHNAEMASVKLISEKMMNYRLKINIGPIEMLWLDHDEPFLSEDYKTVVKELSKCSVFVKGNVMTMQRCDTDHRPLCIRERIRNTLTSPKNMKLFKPVGNEVRFHDAEEVCESQGGSLYDPNVEELNLLLLTTPLTGEYWINAKKMTNNTYTNPTVMGHHSWTRYMDPDNGGKQSSAQLIRG